MIKQFNLQSLDEPVGENNDSYLGDFIIDNNILTEDSVEQVMLKEMLEKSINT